MTRLGFLVLAILLFTPQGARAGESVGTVLAVEGKATVGGLPAALHMPVPERAVLATGAGGRLLVLFADDTELVLGRDARVRLGAAPRFTVERGAFFLAGGGKDEMETPAGRLQLRRARLWGGASGKGGYGFVVSDGYVRLRNARDIAPGMSLRVVDPSLPLPMPSAFTARQLGEAILAVALRNPKAARARVEAVREARRRERALSPLPPLRERVRERE